MEKTLYTGFIKDVEKVNQVHSVMKADLAGDKLHSSGFGINAVWWWDADSP